MEYPTIIATVGGEGTRLFPLTLNISKPLVDICNQAVLTRMLEPLVLQGCRRIVMASKGYENTVQLNKYFKSGAGFFKRLGVEDGQEFEYQPNYEDKGSGDAVRCCMEYYGVKGDALVVSGDNLFDIELDAILRQHREKGALLTIGLKELGPQEDISQFGVAKLDKDMRVSAFVEKPKPGTEPSRLINTSIYVFSQEIRRVFREMGDRVKDMGRDVIPYLTEKGYPVYGYILRGYWADVGTPGWFWKTSMDILHGELKNIKREHEYKPGQWIHPDTVCRTNGLDGVRIKGTALIGRACQIGRNVTIEDSTIGHTCIIAEGTTIRESVVNSFANIGKNTILNRCILGRYTTVEENSRIDAGIEVEFPVASQDRIPVVGGGGVTIVRNSVIGPGKRVAPIHQSHRILSTGRFIELGYDKENVYFRERV
ncbi:MAG: NDP-sugar synthase [Candidatus Hydrothermarchaeota archaeon]